MRIAVFASGGGTNLQSLLDAFSSDPDIDIALVVSNRREAGALERAHRAGVATHIVVDPTSGPEILAVLRDANIDAVVLAGYLKLVPEEVVARFEGRMINIHPALLPSFGGPGMYGQRVHEAVIASGATVSGPTVHLVSVEYDRGAIIAQWPVPVRRDDTPADLAARVLRVEHRLLPEVVRHGAAAGRFGRLTPDTEAFAPTSDPPDPGAVLTQT